MSISYVRHAEIDKQRWDQRIAAASNGIIYANSWYLDIASTGWDALIEGDYDRVMPLTWRRKRGLNYLFQPYFTQQLGVFSSSAIVEADVTRFLESIPGKFKLINIQMNAGNPVPELKGWRKQMRLTHHLDLNREYEIIKQEYTENRQRDLRKAMRSGIEIREVWSPTEHVPQMRTELGNRASDLGAHDWKRLELLMVAARLHSSIRTFEAHLGTSVVAADSILVSNKSVIYLAGFSTQEGKETGATTLIFDHLVREYAGQNLFLDFEGSMIPGIAHFFKSLGGVEVTYWGVSANRLPWPLKLLK